MQGCDYSVTFCLNVKQRICDFVAGTRQRWSSGNLASLSESEWQNTPTLAESFFLALPPFIAHCFPQWFFFFLSPKFFCSCAREPKTERRLHIPAGGQMCHTVADDTNTDYSIVGVKGSVPFTVTVKAKSSS